jgi:selenide, water dikinase
VLDRILPNLLKQSHPNLLVGTSTMDDAGVFKISDDFALVQTLDFFTPIVDDPFDFGRVTAANSLSDVYAMGGIPLTAMNIVAFPDDKLPESVLAEILNGAASVCQDAGVIIVGGHSVSDQEVKFGLSITGSIHPDKIKTNSNAQLGDAIILTKPLGTGLISNAMMNNSADENHIKSMVESMTLLNREASRIAVELGANCLTDITGFGLVGHLREVVLGSEVSATIYANKLPVLPGAMEIASSGSFYSGGERRNLKFVGDILNIEDAVSDPYRRVVSDPQTSGGLIATIPADRVDDYLREIERANEKAWVIGKVIKNSSGEINFLASNKD